jgi:septal ring factor EnvC (AmiA/AmiB activator)
MRAAWTLALLPIAAAFVVSQGNAQPDPAQSDLVDQQHRLLAARAQSAAAAERAAKLDAAAKAEQNEAAKARAQEEAMGARIQQAQADIAAASARVTLVDRLLGEQQARLATQQGPIARLIAALCSLAQRPDAVSVMQPGSVADLVHVRAVIGSTLPLVRARTAGLRADLNNTRRLRADAALAARSLTEGRRRLESNRIALARLEAEHRLKSQDLSRSALAESDRAIGLGERARDLVDNMQVTTNDAATARALAALAGPLPRPDDGTEPPLSWTAASAPYRVPVTGKLVIGFGEVSSDAGVTSRGLTWAVPGGADIAAPAAGKIMFAGPFRDYGKIVVIDHGGGWSTALIGLGTLSVATGQRVGQGALLGAAPQGDVRQVTAELRRKGRPIDPVALTG